MRTFPGAMWLRSEYDLDDLPEPRGRRVLFQDVLLPGAVTGVAGGVLSSVAAMATSAVLGYGATTPLKLLAGTFLRANALEELGLGAALLGLFLHLAGAGALATLFALALPRRKTAVAAVALAMLYGLGIWALGDELVLDFMDPMLARTVPALGLLPFDLLFAACLPFIVPLRRLLEGYVRLRHRTIG